ncbi:hypothetical protein ACLMJK_005350 [Lecanora helva]
MKQHSQIPVSKAIRDDALAMSKAIKKMDPDILAYYERRRRGSIPQCEDANWGCEYPKKRACIRTQHAMTVTHAFLDVDWDKGFAGRGLELVKTQESERGRQIQREITATSRESVSPKTRLSTDPDCSKTRMGKLFRGITGFLSKHGDDYNRPTHKVMEKKHDSAVEGSNHARTPPALQSLRKWMPGRTRLGNFRRRRAVTLYQDSKTGEAASNVGGREKDSNSSNARAVNTPPASQIGKAASVATGSTKRKDVHVSSGESKRRGMSSRSPSGTSDLTSEDDRPNSKNSLFEEPQEYSKDFEMSDGDLECPLRPTSSELIAECSKWIETNVPGPKNDEADYTIVTGIEKIESKVHEPKCASTIHTMLSPRSWDPDEEETLRSWVQDYGIRDWAGIARSLCRSVEDCREQYQKVVMARNKLAGRNLYAGLPGWVDPDLEEAAGASHKGCKKSVIRKDEDVDGLTGPTTDNGEPKDQRLE